LEKELEEELTDKTRNLVQSGATLLRIRLPITTPGAIDKMIGIVLFFAVALTFFLPGKAKHYSVE
jgi:hypothetical protein